MKPNKQRASKSATPITPKPLPVEPFAIIPAVLIGLYAMVGFVPNINAFEVLGPQWVYLTLLNAVCFIYLIYARQLPLVKKMVNTPPAKVYGLFILIAAVTIIYAGNKVEALFNIIRMLTTFLVFLNIAILLYRKKGVIHILFIGLSLILFVESLQTISRFFEEIRQGSSFDKSVLELTLNSGNKNILAASLVIKIPFLLFVIHRAKTMGKIGFGIIFILAVAALVILNARAALVSLILVTGVYLLYYVAQLIKASTRKAAIVKMGFVLLPFLLGIILSNFFIDYSKSLSEGGAASYGSFTERVSSINLSKESSDGRYALWANAIEYIKKHTLLGAGIGNWKLAAIPFDNKVHDDFTASYHVHNDFLELTAETGILGGLVFLSLFAISAWVLFQAYRKKSITGTPDLPLFIFMALLAYGVDAFLNFPLERPVMQFFFAFLMAFIVNIWLTSQIEEGSQPVASPLFKKTVLGTTSIILIASFILHLLYYQSLVAQGKFSQDSLKANPVSTWAEVAGTFPAIPNMNIFCIPIGEIKAKYLIKDKRFDQALRVLDECKDVNPALGFNDYLRGTIYTQLNKIDSALPFAQSAFAKKPRDQNNYYLLSALYTSKSDSNHVKEVFQKELSLRNEAWVWNEYLKNKAAMGTNREQLNKLADSALALFPNDADLQQKKAAFGNTEAYQKILAEGFGHFSRAEFPAAIQSFTRAIEMMPSEYTNYENVALGYYNQNNFATALQWFLKVLPIRKVNNGKSEYFLGICYLQTGNKTEGCRYLKVAAGLQFPDAANQINLHCK